MNRFEVVSKRIVAKVVRGIFSVVRFLADAVSPSDTVSKSLGKPFADTSTASDLFNKSTIKAPIDAAKGSDANTKDVTKNLTDQLFCTDDVNGAGADDDQNINFFKVLSNPSLVVDNFVLLMAFLRSFSNAAQTADAQVLVAGKVAIDMPAASDADVKLTGLGKSDTITGADAGTLLNQDYVDNGFYFADDYVGVKRTF